MPNRYHGYDNDYMAVLCGNWTMNPDTGLWHFHRNLLPQPVSAPQNVKNIEIQVQLDKGVNGEDELRKVILEYQGKKHPNDYGVPVKIFFIVGDKIFGVIVDALLIWAELLKFVNDLKNGKSVRLPLEEYTKETFHLWQKPYNNFVRFAIQNSWHENCYAPEQFDDKWPAEKRIAPWAYAIDIEITKKNLIRAFEGMMNDIRAILVDLFGIYDCYVFDEKADEPAGIVSEDGEKYDKYLPGNWVGVWLRPGNIEEKILPYMRRHRNPMMEDNMRIEIDENAVMRIFNGSRKLKINNEDWTEWYHDVYKWLDFIINGDMATIDFEEEGPSAILSVQRLDKSENVNFLIFANGEYTDEGAKDWKRRLIYTKINKYKLVEMFHNAMMNYIKLIGGRLPNLDWKHCKELPDTITVEKFLNITAHRHYKISLP